MLNDKVKEQLDLKLQDVCAYAWLRIRGESDRGIARVCGRICAAVSISEVEDRYR